MSESEPTMRLTRANGEKMELTHNNTTLYTFLGRTALEEGTFDLSNLNHVFVRTEEPEEGRVKGEFYFEKFHSVYKAIADFAIAHEWPQSVNQRTFQNNDMAQYRVECQKQSTAFAEKLDGVMPSDFL